MHLFFDLETNPAVPLDLGSVPQTRIISGLIARTGKVFTLYHPKASKAIKKLVYSVSLVGNNQ